jgi:hypothetical protein
METKRIKREYEKMTKFVAIMLMSCWTLTNVTHQRRHFCRYSLSVFVSVLFSLLLLLNCVESRQEYQQESEGWTTSTATLSQARALLASTSTNDLIFFAGGILSFTSVSDRVDIYNVTSGIWTTATLSLPRGGLAAASSGNLVFFAGGGNSLNFILQTNFFSGNASNRVDIFNTSDGSWSIATLSQARTGLAATSVGGLILFGGGVSNASEFSNIVDIYNVSNNMWTTATLSQTRAGLAATSIANRYALFAGGATNSSNTSADYSNIVDIYDSFSGLWNTTTLSEAPVDLAATSINNLAFFAGGYEQGNNSGISNVVDIFDSTSQTWSTATLSQARELLAAASIGDIVVFGGGSPDGFTASAVVDMYNVTSNIWLNTTLSQPRAGLAAASSSSSVSTNKILFGGGLSNTGMSNIVDIFDIPLPPPTPVATSTPTPTPKLSVSALIGGSFELVLVLGLCLVISLLPQ